MSVNDTLQQQTIPYQLGYSHGSRKLPPFYAYFSPEGCFEDKQYRQGYIDGSIFLQRDIERTTQHAQRTRLSRLRTASFL